jgi:hypothetical protein
VSNVEPRDWSVESQTVEDTTQNLLPASLRGISPRPVERFSTLLIDLK